MQKVKSFAFWSSWCAAAAFVAVILGIVALVVVIIATPVVLYPYAEQVARGLK